MEELRMTDDESRITHSRLRTNDELQLTTPKDCTRTISLAQTKANGRAPLGSPAAVNLS
jgi:hypothetical protein